jgi:hypothetical protein
VGGWEGGQEGGPGNREKRKKKNKKPSLLYVSRFAISEMSEIFLDFFDFF